MSLAMLRCTKDASIGDDRFAVLHKMLMEAEKENDRLVVFLFRVISKIRKAEIQNEIIYENLAEVFEASVGALERVHVAGEAASQREGELQQHRGTASRKHRGDRGEYQSQKAVEVEIGSAQDRKGSAQTRTQVTKRRKRGKSEPPDPMAPKRPTNAFHIYCQESRGALKEELGRESVGLSETTRILASRWANLDEAEQRKYYDLWECSKKKYAMELKNYVLEIQKRSSIYGDSKGGSKHGGLMAAAN